jgi:hypothetical protein
MLKRITTKESDIVKPLMEKVRTSKVGKAKGFQYVLDGSTLLLAEGTDLRMLKRFRFLIKEHLLKQQNRSTTSNSGFLNHVFRIDYST